MGRGSGGIKIGFKNGMSKVTLLQNAFRGRFSNKKYFFLVCTFIKKHGLRVFYGLVISSC